MMVATFPTQSPHGMIEQSPHGMRGHGGKFARIVMFMIVDESFEGGGSGGYWATGGDGGGGHGDWRVGVAAWNDHVARVLSTVDDAANWMSPEGIPLMPNGLDDLEVYVLHTAANPDWERTNGFYFAVAHEITHGGYFPIAPIGGLGAVEATFIKGVSRTPLTFRDGPATQSDTYDHSITEHQYRNAEFLVVSVKDTDVGLGGPNGPNMIDADVWASRVAGKFPKLRTRRLESSAFPTFFASARALWIADIVGLLEAIGGVWRRGD